MEKLDRKSRLKWIEKGINRISRARSTEKDEDDKRDPHKIPSPFVLAAPHTHQDSEEATKSPATFLACATQPKEGGEEELMGIKFDKKGKKGDQRLVIICKCKNQTETDNQRIVVAQEIGSEDKPVIPQGSHLVASRVVFLPDSQQQAGKTVFLLQITHPAINQNTPKDLIRSTIQALADIKERLKLEDRSHTVESDNKYFQNSMSIPQVPSAPPLEEIVKQEQEQGAAGGALPYEEVDRIPGALKDQDVWMNPEQPAKQETDKTDHMIIIHKKENSQNKQTLKFLAKEKLTKIGWSNLKFPERSQENAQDALPDDIWGYVMRYVQEDKKGARSKEQGDNKPVTFASFIKKDYQNKWMDKAFGTYNLSSELEMTLLISNANEDPALNDLKSHFGKWDGEVMAFLYATIEKEEKEGKEDLQQEQQYEGIIDERKRAVERMEKEMLALKQAHLQEHERQMAEQRADFDKTKKENNDKLKDMYKEVHTIANVINQSRLQSKRVSRATSSRSSRQPSPTDSTRETLRQATWRLNHTLEERKLKERQQNTVGKIWEMENQKKETDSSAEEDATRIRSNEDIPVTWENHEEERKEDKKKLYKVQMALKESQKPKGYHVCPDVACEYISSKEEKIPKHVLGHHGKQLLLVEQALIDQIRIKATQQEEKENQKANKIKLEHETKEEKEENMQKQLKALLDLMEGKTKKEEKTQMKQEAEKKTNKTQTNENTTNTNSDPNSTTPGTNKNQYYKGPGGANSYREQDAGGYGGGGGEMILQATQMKTETTQIEKEIETIGTGVKMRMRLMGVTTMNTRRKPWTRRE